MRQFFRVYTLNRGFIDPPEPLDAENNRKANLSRELWENPHLSHEQALAKLIDGDPGRAA